MTDAAHAHVPYHRGPAEPAEHLAPVIPLRRPRRAAPADPFTPMPGGEAA